MASSVPAANKKNRPAGSNKGSKHHGRQHASNKSRHARDSGINIHSFIPLFLIVGLVPLIVYIKEVNFNDPGNLYWDGIATHYDVFSYYKMVYLLLFAAAGLLLRIFTPKESPFSMEKKTYYIPMGIFSLCVLLSSLASEFKNVAFFGFQERYEGALALFAYMVVMYQAMNMNINEKFIKTLFGCLFASAAIISAIGALQYFGADIYKSGFFFKLITPSSILNKGGKLSFAFGEKTVFSTLYNPDYVGSYMAMIMPAVVVFIVWAKKLRHKAVLSALLLVAAINWIGCGSRAGVIGAVFAFVVIMILFRKNIIRHKWISLAAVVLLIGGFAVLNHITGGSVVNSLTRMATLGMKDAGNESVNAMNKTLEGIIDVKMDDEEFELVTEKGTLRVSIPEKKLQVRDENDADVRLSAEGNNILIDDERFKNIKLVAQPEKGLVEVHYNNYHLIDILLTREGLRSPDNRWLNYRGDREIESWGFEGMETFGSNRGYIWSRTIPLLKDTIVTGKGPDTFALYFPQYDFLNKLRYYQIGGIFVDKAHNMYLQTALNTGVLSLLALLAMFGIYAVSSLKIYWKEDFSGFLPAAGAACFTAFCGYAVAGLANDSVISVAPVFWALLGLGIGINIMLQKERQAAEKAELKIERKAEEKTVDEAVRA
ncbi:MAG: O-antigen ligase family protein [Bacillota bacterium]